MAVYDETQGKQRIIQEYVPGKQVTLAHLIANPDSMMYKKVGAVDVQSGALGIMNITPGEGVIIAADLATKAADVNLVFVDRFSGSLLINGSVSSVETALREAMGTLEHILQFTPTAITKT